MVGNEIIIVGGGHNGLVCACYLAANGHAVKVLERRHIVGGAAVTEEFYPGFRNSTASYTVSLLHPKVIKDCRLVERGLKIIERPYSNFLPLENGAHIKIGGGLAATQAEVARFSMRDAQALPRYYAMLDTVADVLRDTLLTTPPNIGGGLTDFVASLKLLKRFKALDMAARRDVLDLFTKSAGEVLDSYFESVPIKAAFGFDAVVGNFASPYTPGSAYVLLHHVFGEVNGKKGIWGHAVGGMGAITQALAAEAIARGVQIQTECAVEEVLVENGAAVGVRLVSGKVLRAKRVVSNLNPKLLFGKMVAPQHLDADFTQRISNYQCGSGTFRMNVALDTLPNFACMPHTEDAGANHHQSGIIMAPSMAYMERAFFDAKLNGYSQKPIVEILIPSTVDSTLAPAGKHVASLFCQHFNPKLEAGQSWDNLRETAANIIIDTVNSYAPNFKQSIIASQIHSPLDLERKFGLVDGDIFHGRLSLDQLFSARPILGHGNYGTPIKGLYQCGSGTHPGGGVTGVPGHNAAREVLRGL
jgi:phytoene dehydrogenase-like protein